MILETLMSLGYIGILALVIAINLLPFASPSNLVLAGVIVYFTGMNPLAVALLVAAGATVAKLVHFRVAAAVGSRVDESKFGKYGKLLRNWGALGAFVAAATPIPDDPIVIPLGLMKYNIVKFGVSYFLGKLTITLIGAYTARSASLALANLLGDNTAIIGSIVLSILVVTVLMKTDPSNLRSYVSKLLARFRRTH
jgi:membrane protein DedA with SNARE-associated domain